MASYRFFMLSICLIWLLCQTQAEVVEFSPCEVHSGADRCIINEVRVNSCTKTPCKIKKGKPTIFEVDYTTLYFTELIHCFAPQLEWNATNVYGGLYAIVDESEEAFPGMRTDACEFTSCPIRESVQQTYQYTLNLSRKTPQMTFNTRWILRDAAKDDTTPDRCCFTISIKVTK